MSGTPDFGGYRLIASDGGVFSFGDAPFYGSAAGPGTSGWEALTSVPSGGYWLVANAPGCGSLYLLDAHWATSIAYSSGEPRRARF